MVISSGTGALPRQVDANKAAQRAAIVPGAFHGGIGQVEPALEKINSQYLFDADLGTRCTSKPGAKPLNDFNALLPGSNILHHF